MRVRLPIRMSASRWLALAPYTSNLGHNTALRCVRVCLLSDDRVSVYIACPEIAKPLVLESRIGSIDERTRSNRMGCECGALFTHGVDTVQQQVLLKRYKSPGVTVH